MQINISIVLAPLSFVLPPPLSTATPPSMAVPCGVAQDTTALLRRPYGSSGFSDTGFGPQKLVSMRIT
jgi:hypothetical protein